MSIRIRILLAMLALSSPTAALADPLKGGVQKEVTVSTPMSGGILDQGNPLFGSILDEGNPTLLPGGATFSETVTPVAPDIKPHKLFSSITMPPENKEDLWYQIPKWRAGLYHRDKQIDHTLTGDVESVSKVDHLYGMQVDRKGGIWHHESWPSITKLSLDGYSEYKIINRYEPISMTNKEFCVKISSTNIDVDDKTGKVTRVAKQEEIDRYFPVGQGVARGHCLIQGFSARGNQNTQVEKCTVEESMTQPFRVLNTFRGKNLRESFINFLKSHDMADLAPIDSDKY